eukprot:TRINITY_DN972_c0_g2_i1.p1 TRINITY_DN972_c0_g2~~TRINITY_DN972_c0_g2_i1.p1  ORF type:complete len:146 (+),score=12.72 TRINITY_DN972_c0_g2_i1:2-439(+)
MKVIILCVLLLAAAQATLVQSHDYWYTAQKAIVKTGAPLADYAWNYCDLKCLYFEHYYKGQDFVYIEFNPGFFKPNFAACFVRNVLGNGTATYALWNTVVTNNTWYSKYCGGDTANYWQESQGANPKYTVVAVKGIGIGNYPAPY